MYGKPTTSIKIEESGQYEYEFKDVIVFVNVDIYDKDHEQYQDGFCSYTTYRSDTEIDIENVVNKEYDDIDYDYSKVKDFMIGIIGT